jgi:ectoine hydroxylase-related dioxygenase (phytanoyl-CoA dioxygenase family)
VIRRAFADTAIVDRVSAAFDEVIAAQRADGTAGGDHFAKPGTNDRVWNALEKLALRDPAAFADYYANDVLGLAATAWLGPAYQVTSQLNVVNPGGAAQTGHRDYHLGFMSAEQAEHFPAAVHRLSPALTLQGAVAHCDMPVESGPTMYLPHPRTTCSCRWRKATPSSSIRH